MITSAAEPFSVFTRTRLLLVCDYKGSARRMQSRARSSYAEPQPSLAVHLQLHCKGTTFFWFHQIFLVKECKYISLFCFYAILPHFQTLFGLLSFKPLDSDFQACKPGLSSLQTLSFRSLLSEAFSYALKCIKNLPISCTVAPLQFVYFVHPTPKNMVIFIYINIYK